MASNFGGMLDKIYMNEFVALLPSWVDKVRKRESDNSNTHPNILHNGGGNQNNNGNGGGVHGGLQAHHLREWEKGMKL